MTPPKPKLEDVGTRYKHLADLLDGWMDGIESIKSSYKAYPTDNVKKRQTQLEGAVALLQTHMDKMAEYDIKQFGLREVINRIPKLPKTEVVDGSENKEAKQPLPVGKPALAEGTET